MTTKAIDIEATLLAMADEGQANILRRFFKTGPGDYGEGDKFAGLKNPQVRLVVKEAWRTTPLEEAVELVRNEIHEVRLCGLLIMVEQYLRAMKRKDEDAMRRIVDTYLSLHPYINNWDLVDLSAIKIIGNYDALHPEWTLMDEWIRPGHTLWQRRIAMVSTWILTRKGRPEVCFERAEQLLDTKENLLHKAAGWMLREAWKKGYREELRDFLSKHVNRMPSVMLSYACEQMPELERKDWRQMKTRINHIGLYVQDLEAAKCFFEKYFGATAGEMYHNPRKDFKSYLLTLGNGSRLELMMRPGMTEGKALGVCHISLSVGSKEAVDIMTETLRNDGYEVADGPRTTGDGYYESSIVGVEGNLIEITV